MLFKAQRGMSRPTLRPSLRRTNVGVYQGRQLAGLSSLGHIDTPMLSTPRKAGRGAACSLSCCLETGLKSGRIDALYPVFYALRLATGRNSGSADALYPAHTLCPLCCLPKNNKKITLSLSSLPHFFATLPLLWSRRPSFTHCGEWRATESTYLAYAGGRAVVCPPVVCMNRSI